ncbi:hypothetical protein IKG07_03440 [Candidatus Saccharibacteria bacterium]|nr:hypothetical protein [Candidatus Saccharibacteria bacterium]
MGRVKEALMEFRDREEPTGNGYGRLDTTGYKPRKKDPDEVWRERGYYPDGEKYDYGDEEDDIPEFDPETARKAREEALKHIKD